MKHETWLLYPAGGDIDEDDGLTKEQLLKELADELGYVLTRPEEDDDEIPLTLLGTTRSKT